VVATHHQDKRPVARASAAGRRLPARGDAWGGLAAMLVALPAAIAFGVSVYTVLGPGFAGHGALAGLVGVALMGMVAAWLGGTERLVSAPCAPAAAVLSAFAAQMLRDGAEPRAIILCLLLVGALGGLIQVVFGLVGLGRLIRYIPYPVVSGYLTGVGLIIIGAQIPALLGAPADLGWQQALAAPGAWDARALVVAAATIAGAWLGPRLTRQVPGTVFGIAAGIGSYFLLALGDGALLTLADNPLLVGPLQARAAGLPVPEPAQWRALAALDGAQVAAVLGNAVILAALLSIDTLKTCVVLDKLTRSRHDPDRELRGQGAANLATAACGGLAGAGTMGATLVALNSGAATRRAGLLAGAFALVAAVAVGSLIGWIPVAALAAILVTIGVRMIDREALGYARARATFLDFCVVLTVVAVAIGVGLIMASAVGVGLAMILFVREQSGGSPVRHKLELDRTSSTWHRPTREVEYLATRAPDCVVFELQGALFFGNTYRLYNDLAREAVARRFVIIDFRRVPSIDVTAIEILLQVRAAIRERGATLVLCGTSGRSGRARTLSYLVERLAADRNGDGTVVVLPDLDGAVAWVENRILADAEVGADAHAPIPVHDLELFAGYRDDTLADLEQLLEIRAFAAGSTIYERGSDGAELFWVRRGAVSLLATVGAKPERQVAGFGRGDFFGARSFLDRKQRPSRAVAMVDTEVYVLTRTAFEEIARSHRTLALNLAWAMARALASRMRRAEERLAALSE
jgi:SulP family sulfate permease